VAGFASLKQIVERDVDDGAVLYTTWRKAPVVTTGQGFWLDLSMSPGNPKPNYYAATPLQATALAQSSDGGLFHGGAVSPATLHLRRMTAMTQTAGAVPLPMVLCDYLLFYPVLDEGVVDEAQTLANPVTLPRYTDGDNVRIMAVVTAPHVTGTGTKFAVSYTNSRGVSGRTSKTVQLGTQTVNGTIATSGQATAQCFGPFVPLQDGDSGVRSIESVTFTGVPDVGLLTLVLVRPLADVSLRGVDAAVEVDFLTDKPSLPRIYDDAYLNWLVLAAGNVTGAQINGEAWFSWS